MYVAVGSTNPVKREAVSRVLQTETDSLTVDPVPVDSGVSEQPTTLSETVTGAETRAKRALESTDAAEYGVGLEGGVAQLEGVPGWSLLMWAAVTDGQRVECGGGPTVRLPETVADPVADGEELGPVIDRVYGTENAGEKRGAIWQLTAGRIDRTAGLEVAVAGAFGPFLVAGDDPL